MFKCCCLSQNAIDPGTRTTDAETLLQSANVSDEASSGRHRKNVAYAVTYGLLVLYADNQQQCVATTSKTSNSHRALSADKQKLRPIKTTGSGFNSRETLVCAAALARAFYLVEREADDVSEEKADQRRSASASASAREAAASKQPQPPLTLYQYRPDINIFEPAAPHFQLPAGVRSGQCFTLASNNKQTLVLAGGIVPHGSGDGASSSGSTQTRRGSIFGKYLSRKSKLTLTVSDKCHVLDEAQLIKGDQTTWVPIAQPLQQARINPLVAVTADNLIVVTGGTDAAGVVVRSAELLDWSKYTESPVWQRLPDMPLDYSCTQSACAVLNRVLYVTGGLSAEGITNAFLLALDLTKPTEWHWLTPMHQPRFAHSLVAMNNRLYAVGGRCKPAHPLAPNAIGQLAKSSTTSRSRTSSSASHQADVSTIRSIELYDPDMNQWYLLGMKLQQAQADYVVALVQKT